MEKTKKKLLFTIHATIEISASEVYRLREVEAAIEHLQGFGTAEIVDIEVILVDEND